MQALKTTYNGPLLPKTGPSFPALALFVLLLLSLTALLRLSSSSLVTKFTTLLSVQAFTVLHAVPARALLPFTATCARKLAKVTFSSAITSSLVSFMCAVVKRSTGTTSAEFERPPKLTSIALFTVVSTVSPVWPSGTTVCRLVLYPAFCAKKI